MTRGEAPLAAESPLLSADAIFARIAARIPVDIAADALDGALLPPTGDHVMNDSWIMPEGFLARTRVAAVLVGLVEREEGVTVLLTQRTAGLRDHAGQIAFPGGKMDPGDATPAATALREAREEVGLPAERVDVLGHLGTYLTGSGFRIVPVIARIRPPVAFVLNPAEVVEAFEVPFAHLMSAASYQLRHREWKGASRAFYAVEYGERTIWGITAGILRILHDTLYGP